MAMQQAGQAATTCDDVLGDLLADRDEVQLAEIIELEAFLKRSAKDRRPHRRSATSVAPVATPAAPAASVAPGPATAPTPRASLLEAEPRRRYMPKRKATHYLSPELAARLDTVHAELTAPLDRAARRKVSKSAIVRHALARTLDDFAAAGTESELSRAVSQIAMHQALPHPKGE